jgi:hypothetical protein
VSSAELGLLVGGGVIEQHLGYSQGFRSKRNLEWGIVVAVPGNIRV